MGTIKRVSEFADHLRAAGQRVTMPDLYDGATFDTLDDNIALCRTNRSVSTPSSTPSQHAAGS